MEKQGWWQWGGSLLIGGGAIATLVCPASAQVVADPSLGTTVTPLGLTSIITNGTTVGGRNLFHSFSRFDVPDNGTAIFLNAPTIANIFARVTGGTVSDIRGVISAQGTANLFLMNPQGVLFGPNAQLNLGGSFVATSANAIQFPNGGSFSQTSPVDSQNSLLSVDPSAFFFNQINPGRIENRSNGGLALVNGSLLLVGGDVLLDRALLVVQDGRIEVAGLAEPGTIALTRTGNLLSLSVPEGVRRSQILLTNNTRIQAPAASVVITAESLFVSNGSQIASFAFDGRNAGDVVINAGDRVSFSSTSATGGIGSAAFSTVLPGATGRSGNVRISTGSLELTNQSGVGAFTSGAGDAGDVVIEARDRVFLSQASGIANLVQVGATGRGGSVRIATGSLEATTGAQLIASTRGQGNAGGVVVEARDRVSFDASAVLSTVETGASGAGGAIRIATNVLDLTNGAQLTTSTRGQGSAGDITLIARDRISLAGTSASGRFASAAASTVEAGAIGNGGNVRISTGSLDVTNGAQLIASTRGQGNAGSVVIAARDRVSFNGMSANSPLVSAALSAVEAGAVGNGGSITITAASLDVTNGAGLSVNTNGQGNAGDITIAARDRVSLQNTGSIFSAVETGAVGDGGNIRITTGSLDVLNGSQLTVGTRGQGNAGNIAIAARDRVFFSGLSADGRFASAAISTVETGGIGNGGNVNVIADSLELRNGAQLAAGTRGRGDAGDIVVIVRGRVAIAGTSSDGQTISGIFASSESGGQAGDILIDAASVQLDNRGILSARSAAVDGGNITLNVRDLLLLRRGSLISATAGEAQQAGNGGNITINAPTGFILAVPLENSDITANAFTGRGGNVQITAQGIFGLQFRPQLTPLSDITASSQFGFSGVVIINTPDLDPNRGLVPLPSGLVDATSLIAQQCTGRRASETTSAFYISGRGGIPYRPGDSPSSQFPTGDVRSVEENGLQRSLESFPGGERSRSSAPSPSPIMEATNWVVDRDGTVVLVAQTPAQPGLHRTECPPVSF